MTPVPSQSAASMAMTTCIDGLTVHVYPEPHSAGAAAGAALAGILRDLLRVQLGARVAFAAAPSQDEMLDRLCAEPGIDWTRVTAFQLDEYAQLEHDHPATFGNYLRTHLFDHVRPGEVRLMSPGDTPDEAAARYVALLASAPLDVVCLGIGENGHLAFNDPPDADPDDAEPVRVVRLSERSRVQQVNDGCFPDITAVPTHAVTLTLPALLSGRRLVCTVSGPRKRDAVTAALSGPVTPACPASYLRRHKDAVLYLDLAAAESGLTSPNAADRHEPAVGPAGA